MTTWTGRLVQVDLGAGAWVLETRTERILLVGSVPGHLAGQEVEVHGEELEDGMSFAMTGDKMVQVARVERR
jgi:hypothetical protein